VTYSKVTAIPMISTRMIYSHDREENLLIMDQASFGVLLRPVWWIWIGAKLLCLTRAAKCKGDECLIFDA